MPIFPPGTQSRIGGWNRFLGALQGGCPLGVDRRAAPQMASDSPSDSAPRSVKRKAAVLRERKASRHALSIAEGVANLLA